MGLGELNSAIKGMSVDEYMLKNRFIVKQEDDCFTKMARFFE